MTQIYKNQHLESDLKGKAVSKAVKSLGINKGREKKQKTDTIAMIVALARCRIQNQRMAKKAQCTGPGTICMTCTKKMCKKKHPEEWDKLLLGKKTRMLATVK